ncbi:MAG: glycosyltransferase [Verrucomicrobiota bacterium]|nr:glycosyltransferase [Verrucomicrobiota bacterium]
MTSAPRILLASHEATLSGAPVQLVYLAEWLVRTGWCVLVVAPEDGPIGDKLRASRVPFSAIPELLLEPDFSSLRRLARNCDIVVANTITTWQAVQAARLENVPVVWYLHETLVGRRLITQIPQIAATLPFANGVVTPTRATAAVYEAWTRVAIDVVPYGIAAASITGPLCARDKLSFITLGTFEERKGQDVLIAAIDALKPSARDSTLFRLAGRNLEPEFHRRLSESTFGLTNVKLLGPAEHEQSLALLDEADVLIVPSRDETMPIVILEAMSRGKAVISTDVGGISEWLRDGLNALLVPSDNPAALRRAIEKCSDDPDLVRKLGAAGKRTFERHFTIERFGAAFELLLRRTIEKRRTGALQPLLALGWPELYERWVREFDTFSASDRVRLGRRIRALRAQPLISVVVPVYNPDLGLLESAIDSVRQQVYPNWELCLADDASTDPAVRRFLDAAVGGDARIKVVFRETNGQIAACSNSAIAIGNGEWLALLDQDDAIAPNALAEVACEIDAHSAAAIIYSDEDKIDLNNVRSAPFFKGDWNAELFVAQNYINHLGVYRASLVREIGGFRAGFEGSQDYDLALRGVERVRPEQIRHVPRVLYHWRTVTGSLAETSNAKPHARDAARRAIREHLRRRDIAALVEACPENPESHRVSYTFRDPAPLVSIVVPTRDAVAILRRCIDGLQDRTAYRPLEIVIVDNGSEEPEAREYLRGLTNAKNIQVVRDERPFNFSRLNNIGARGARGTILAFLNNDIEVNDSDWLGEMVSHARRVQVGAVGARLWYPDGTLQHGGVMLGLGGVAGHAHHRIPHGHPGYFNRAFLQQECSAVTAACMVVRKDVFDRVGGFNEIDVAVNFNDVELCLRLRRLGLKIIWTPYANLRHHESLSRGSRASTEQQQLFVREAEHMQTQWGEHLLSDPFYSPNLRLELPAFYPAFPPREDSVSASKMR